ncbi:MAG: hypothetical protein ACREP9_01555 [Candidatus Dormibacteraceae bacterium]
MGLYTLFQLVEVGLFGAVLIFGLLEHRPSVALFGGGLLIGKAVLNILSAEGGTVVRRSLVGYGLGAGYVIFWAILIHRYF